MGTTFTRVNSVTWEAADGFVSPDVNVQNDRKASATVRASIGRTTVCIHYWDRPYRCYRRAERFKRTAGAPNGSFADIPEPRDGFRSKRYRFAKHIQRTYPEASGAIQGSVDNQGLAGFRVRGRPDYVVVVALVVAVFSWSDFHG